MLHAKARQFSNNDPMKHVRRFVTALVIVGVIFYFVVPAMLLPKGVWRRRVVRDHPLKAPTAITAVRGDTLVSAHQEFRLAGVTLPADPGLSARASDFLRVSTAQGVEIVRPMQPEGRFILRCEPRIWHWCGNDAVEAHYEQFNLNELLIAFGYATYDSSFIGLTDDERLRLKGAEAIARQRHRGMWSRTPGASDRSFRPDLGLNISDAFDLRTMIEFTALELAEQR